MLHVTQSPLGAPAATHAARSRIASSFAVPRGGMLPPNHLKHEFSGLMSGECAPAM